MNHGPLIFLGALVTMAISWCGLIFTPQLQLGRMEQAPMKLLAPAYPAGRPGIAAQGREVYRALGCAECHTQQVRPSGDNTDLERGWGLRRTVARDFLTDSPVLVGRLRVGPDLANIAIREPKQFAVPWQYKTQSNHVEELELWHYAHLYNPRAVSPGSIMPAYRYLFEERTPSPKRPPSLDALPPEITARLTGVKNGAFEIVPRREARALVAYLMSLRADAPLFEAPVQITADAKVPNAASATNAPATNASGTNAPATNVPATPAPISK